MGNGAGSLPLFEDKVRQLILDDLNFLYIRKTLSEEISRYGIHDPQERIRTEEFRGTLLESEEMSSC